MARSDAGQLKSDAGGSERLQDSAGAAFTQLLCQQLASKMAAWDHTPHDARPHNNIDHLTRRALVRI